MTLVRRFASATLQLSVGSALARLLLLVSTPVLTRWLTPDAFGAAAMLATAVALLSVLALTGVDMSYVRSFNSASAPNGAAAERFAWQWSMGSAAICGALGCLLWIIWLAPRINAPAYFGALLAAGVICTVAQIMAQVRARLHHRFRPMAIAVVLAGILALCVSLAIAYFFRNDGLAIVAAAIVTTAVPVAVLGTPGLQALKQRSGLKPAERSRFLKIGLAGVVTAPMYWAMTSLDRWFLGFHEGAASVGIYSVGVSVGMMGAVFNSAIQSFWLPEASKSYEENPITAQTALGSLAERVVVSLAIVWLAMTAAGGDVVRLITAPAFHDAARVVPFIAGAVFFNGLVQLGMDGLLLSKRLGESIPICLMGGLACAGLNSILVPALSQLGAALAQALVFAAVGLALLCASQRHFPLKLRIGRLLLILSAVFASGMLMHPAWAQTSPVWSLLAKLPVGVALAGAAVHLISPGAIASGFKLIRVSGRIHS